ncbi:hypothetical protein TRFO_13940 [Tritrichomonas foetus]|uniref:Uncharacterized protein n=1 Tax=Tritrichomonas foetus TaxID=1144522 RepID=A0A1J4KWJ9_9EUKA|nr:hypothetical protein TRFO_13940 [Tritrichomonas foetus]|eukprot:OHT15619.1 hypothetical protein TRFO_13940 [Tritrichomonas foetus]
MESNKFIACIIPIAQQVLSDIQSIPQLESCQNIENEIFHRFYARLLSNNFNVASTAFLLTSYGRKYFRYMNQDKGIRGYSSQEAATEMPTLWTNTNNDPLFCEDSSLLFEMLEKCDFQIMQEYEANNLSGTNIEDIPYETSIMQDSNESFDNDTGQNTEEKQDEIINPVQDANAETIPISKMDKSYKQIYETMKEEPLNSLSENLIKKLYTDTEKVLTNLDTALGITFDVKRMLNRLITCTENEFPFRFQLSNSSSSQMWDTALLYPELRDFATLAK